MSDRGQGKDRAKPFDHLKTFYLCHRVDRTYSGMLVFNLHRHRRHRACKSTDNKRKEKHSHGHAKLLQPLLFQLFGFEEELKAVLALVVSEVESVGPLQHIKIRFLKTEKDERQEDRWGQKDTKIKEGCLGERRGDEEEEKECEVAAGYQTADPSSELACNQLQLSL